VSGPFDHHPVGSVRLTAITRDPEHVSPRTGLGLRRVSAERVAEFKEMLEEDPGALPEPICVESQGSLILADGHHRLAALEQLAHEHPDDRRFECTSVRIANTPSGDTPSIYAYEIALECSAKGPLPLTRVEKQTAILRLLTEHPERSDREIARRVGVDHKTVGTVRKRGISPLGLGSPRRQVDPSHVGGSAVRIARIAVQIVRYGDELGTADSDIDYEEIVREFGVKLREHHPTTAYDWARWWEGVWRQVQTELDAR